MTPEEIQAKIDAAVEELTSGLKTKNAELLGEVKKLKKGATVDPAEVEKLESTIEELRGKLTETEKAAKKAAKDAETAAKALQAESSFTEKLLKQNGLAAELAKNGVTNPALLEAAQAMLGSQVHIVIDGENRVVKMSDKALADAVKEWAGSDKGKHFVSATGNSGGGAAGGARGGDPAKTMTRTQFGTLSAQQKTEFGKAGGTLTD